MERFVGKIAVVTGTSSGSGLEIAKELLRRGVDVAGFARRTNLLEKLRDETDNSAEYKGKFYPVTCDVTKKTDINSAMEWVFNNLGPVYILVNNAGLFVRTSLLDASLDQIKAQFDVFVKATVLCTQQVVKNMKENRTEGHIININGLLGMVSVNLKPPDIYMLFASAKHAQRVFSEGFRREMLERKLNIKITNLSPAYVNTDASRGLDLGPEYEETILSPKDVADSCIAVLDTTDNVVISEMVVMPLNLKF